jgi:hypothetical protein
MEQDIINALRVHDGEANLTDLYITYGTIRAAAGRSLPNEWRAAVRHKLQTTPIFASAGRGRWRLRLALLPRARRRNDARQERRSSEGHSPRAY